MPVARRRTRYPAGLEREYASAIKKYARWLGNETIVDMRPVIAAIEADAAKYRNDAAWHSTLVAAAGRLLSKARDKLKDLFGAVKRYAFATNEHSAREMRANVKSALGTNVYVPEPWLPDKLAAWQQENLRLLDALPLTHVQRLQAAIAASASSNAPLLRTVVDINHKLIDSASLLGCDQIGSLFADLNETRQRALGATDYVWRGVMDARERPSHVAREGKRYSYAKGPPNGLNPGREIRCRCVADAIFPSLAAIKGHIVP